MNTVPITMSAGVCRITRECGDTVPELIQKAQPAILAMIAHMRPRYYRQIWTITGNVGKCVVMDMHTGEQWPCATFGSADGLKWPDNTALCVMGGVLCLLAEADCG